MKEQVRFETEDRATFDLGFDIEDINEVMYYLATMSICNISNVYTTENNMFITYICI